MQVKVAKSLHACCVLLLLLHFLGTFAQAADLASFVCSSFSTNRSQQVCTASLASLASPFQAARSATRSLLAAEASPQAFLSLAYTFWCAAHTSLCDPKAQLAHNYTTDASALPSSITIPVPYNNTWIKVAAYSASGLFSPRIGQRTTGTLCTPTASDCFLEASLPVQQSNFRLRATFICFMANITTNSTTLLGYPNGTGPVYTVSSRPVDNTITCRTTTLGPLFVAFYYPLESAGGLDRHQTIENNPTGQKYLTLHLKFQVQLAALSQSEQDEFRLNIRKSIALQLGYVEGGTNTSSGSVANGTQRLQVGNVEVVSVSGATVITRVYAQPNMSDWNMWRLWKRMQATDGHDLFGDAFAEKYGEEMFTGAGFKDKKSQWRQKVIWTSVAVGAVLLTAGGIVWFWKALYKQNKAAAAP